MAAMSSDVDALVERLEQVEVNKRVEVNFKDRKLKLDTAEDAKDIVEDIRACDGMTALTLSGNTVGVKAAQAIADVLETKSTFQHALWSDMFTGRLRAEIPPSLRALGGAIIKSSAQLTEVDLSDNAFGPDGVQACVELLTSPAAYTLKILKFNNNGLGIGGGKILSKALQDCYEAASEAGRLFPLKEFIAGRNRLENEGAEALARAFKVIGTLRHLSLPQNGIHHAGISALADALTQNKDLQHLDLNDNTFTEKGSEAMARALPMLQMLEVINFGDCLVKPSGATVIAEALKEGHMELKELHLGYDELDRVSGLQVVTALQNKPKLERLHMNGNRFGASGIEDIRSAVQRLSFSHDILDSLSDDEGDASDDDNEDDGYQDEEGAELSGGEDGDSVREESEGDISTDPELQVKGTAIELPLANDGTPSDNQTAALFLENPTADGLIALGDDRVDLIRKELEGQEDNARTMVAVFCAVSSVLDSHDPPSDVVAAVNQISDALLESAFVNDSAGVVVELLSHLGLIKSEDKMKPLDDISGPLLALEHVVRQSYFPKSSVDTFIAFMSKSNLRLDASSDARHRLLQALHSR